MWISLLLSAALVATIFYVGGWLGGVNQQHHGGMISPGSRRISWILTLGSLALLVLDLWWIW